MFDAKFLIRSFLDLHGLVSLQAWSWKKFNRQIVLQLKKIHNQNLILLSSSKTLPNVRIFKMSWLWIFLTMSLKIEPELFLIHFTSTDNCFKLPNKYLFRKTIAYTLAGLSLYSTRDSVVKILSYNYSNVVCVHV